MNKSKKHNILTLILILIGVTLNTPMLFNNIAVGLLLICFIINYKQFNKQGSIILYLLPFIIVVFDFLSVFNSIDYESALKILEKRSVLFIFPVFFLLMPKVSNKTLSLVFKYFIYSLTLTCLIALFLAFKENYNIYGFTLNYQSVWIIGHHNLSNHVGFHATYLSNFILFALSIITIYKHKSFRINKRLKISIVIILMTCFLLLSVRTTFVTFVILVFYMVFNIFKHNKLKLTIGIFASALLIAVLFFNSTMLKERVYDVFSIGKSKEKSRFGGNSIRMYNWTSAYEIFKENKIFGIGNGDVKEALNKKYELIDQDEFVLTDYNSHNQYLNALATKGIIGGLVLIGFICIAMFYAIKHNNKLLLILIVINSISFITENVLTRNKGVLFLFYFYCLLVSNLDFNLLKKEE